jgi:hypothetical protein
MGINFIKVYKGAGVNSSNTSPRAVNQLTPQNINFLYQIGLTPRLEHGHVRHWR